MHLEIDTRNRTHVYTSEQIVSGGGSRNCIDWILNSKASGAQKVIIYLPNALPTLVTEVQRHADKIIARLNNIQAHVVRTKKELRKARFASY